MLRGVSRLSRRAFIAGVPVASAAAAQVTGVTGQSAGTVDTPASKGRLLHVEAKPDRVDLDLSRTGVIVVDMQNDFAANGGLVHRLGFDIKPIQQTIPRIAGL